MKRFVVFCVLLSFGICFFGCAKKEESAQELPESMNMELLSSAGPSTQNVNAQAGVSEVQVAEPYAPQASAQLEPLPPQGPYKPTSKEIQTALKNAGFYGGEIDGKIGPQSKKAIEEFQKVNSLEVDGKVGPKTWAVLGKYLNPAPAPEITTVPVTASSVKKKR